MLNELYQRNGFWEISSAAFGLRRGIFRTKFKTIDITRETVFGKSLCSLRAAEGCFCFH